MEVAVVSSSIWVIVKIFFIVGIVVYSVFALVVLKQVNIMTETLDVGMELPIKVLAYLHLIFAILVLVFALIVL